MSFVLVTADFPLLDPEVYSIIVRRLEQKNWVRLHEHELMESTIWLYPIAPEHPEEAIKIARHNFTACCIPYCIPRLAVEWSASDSVSAHPLEINQ